MIKQLPFQTNGGEERKKYSGAGGGGQLNREAEKLILSYYDRTGIPILRIVIVSSLKRYFLDFVTEKRKYKDNYNCPKIDVHCASSESFGGDLYIF